MRPGGDPRVHPFCPIVLRDAMIATGATSSGDETLFEFEIERVLLSLYKLRGEPDNWPPRCEQRADPVITAP